MTFQREYFVFCLITAEIGCDSFQPLTLNRRAAVDVKQMDGRLTEARPLRYLVILKKVFLKMLLRLALKLYHLDLEDSTHSVGYLHCCPLHGDGLQTSAVCLSSSHPEEVITLTLKIFELEWI